MKLASVYAPPAGVRNNEMVLIFETGDNHESLEEYRKSLVSIAKRGGLGKFNTPRISIVTAHKNNEGHWYFRTSAQAMFSGTFAWAGGEFRSKYGPHPVPIYDREPPE